MRPRRLSLRTSPRPRTRYHRRRFAEALPPTGRRRYFAKLAISILQICFCKSLAGSVSAVSKRNFAKNAFDIIFQDLQDVHTFAPLQSQNFSKKNRFEKSAINFLCENSTTFCKCCKICKICQFSKNATR